jgi:hypothetical protein
VYALAIQPNLVLNEALDNKLFDGCSSGGSNSGCTLVKFDNY